MKRLGEKLGSQVKEEIDKTGKEISDIVQAGVGIGTVDQVRKLVQDKSRKIEKMGKQAFDQGFEQVKPLLEKNPKVKQLVEEKMETLKSGNVRETVDKVRDAVSSDNTESLENYMQQ